MPSIFGSREDGCLSALVHVIDLDAPVLQRLQQLPPARRLGRGHAADFVQHCLLPVVAHINVTLHHFRVAPRELAHTNPPDHVAVRALPPNAAERCPRKHFLRLLHRQSLLLALPLLPRGDDETAQSHHLDDFILLHPVRLDVVGSQLDAPVGCQLLDRGGGLAFGDSLPFRLDFRGRGILVDLRVARGEFGRVQNRVVVGIERRENLRELQAGDDHRRASS
mmetsp:Transcript_3208/g.7988  ORF Transcript_3208/g.7988 Transcript_3208/m.7988 type:complete len:222 (-) Transcript_3208:43-708(-)